MQVVFKHKILDLSTPAVMGILNITPDSFYDGGKYLDTASVLRRAEKMLEEGADIIDIGGVSTRPGADAISEEEEYERIVPAIKEIRKQFQNAILSVDTFRSRVASEALDCGADMINDVSGGSMDIKMFKLVEQTNVPYVLMHMKGTPQTMQKEPDYRDIVSELKEYFKEKIKNLKCRNIILDPGFGFGKTVEHNYSLLKHLAVFKEFRLPILAGISRKSMINKVLGTTPATALNGTTAANTIALMNGANILRVHDVKEAVETVKIFNFTK